MLPSLSHNMQTEVSSSARIPSKYMGSHREPVTVPSKENNKHFSQGLRNICYHSIMESFLARTDICKTTAATEKQWPEDATWMTLGLRFYQETRLGSRHNSVLWAASHDSHNSLLATGFSVPGSSFLPCLPVQPWVTQLISLNCSFPYVTVIEPISVMLLCALGIHC